MSLTTVIASKEGNYAPLLLATFTFADGTVLRASTHNLNAAEGGNQYAGHDYLARIDQQDIQQIQARSEQGIDRISDVTLHLYNVDQVILNDYEMGAGKGFKGAILSLVLVLMDIDSSGSYTFSTDSPAPVQFEGICDPGQVENGGATLSVRATTSHNLGRVDFPILHVQPRCINVFPGTALQRLLGGTDMSSWWWGCGYNPDQAGTDPEIGGDCRRGNLNGGVPFTSCNYTKADCVARGMYSKDSSNRRTGRFTAIQWQPAWREQQQISYTQGKSVSVFAGLNESIYSRSYPMLYGTQWVKRPIVVAPIGDGNATRFEVVVCVGDVGSSGILQVLVNGVIVPRNFGPGSTDPLFRWNFVGDPALNTPLHTGGRNGQATLDSGFALAFNPTLRIGTPLGDPYGGLAALEIVCYSDLVQSNSIPDVRVLCAGPKVKVPNTANPSDQATWPYQQTVLPPWHTLDMLIWGNSTYGEWDIQSFRDEASYCSGTVSYTDLTGATASHERFRSEFVLEDRRKANEVIQAHLRSYNAQLRRSPITGKQQLFIRKSLCEQQGSAVPGSNYSTTGILSYRVGDAIGSPTGTGYPAYLIDESVIQQDGRGNMKVRGPYCLSSAQAPNRIMFGFQDSDNHYADDSISIVDTDDVARAAGYQLGGQSIDAGISVAGVSNFDQGTRITNCILAETLRGNENGDTRGTRVWDVETTHRLAHIKVGDIVLFRYQANALRPAVQLQSPPGTPIAGILCRVEVIKPTTNYRRMTLTLRWHEDVWYTDAYGQQPVPLLSDQAKTLPARPPYPWRPYAEQPVAGDSLWGANEYSFTLAQSYQPAANGAPIAALAIAGNPTLNQPSSAIQPPLTGLQGATANTGGTIAGNQRIYGAIAVQDSDGNWTVASRPFLVDLPSGTNTNTVTTPTIRWQTGAVNWALFAGTDEQTMCAQSSGTGTPSTITITALKEATYGPPDLVADSLSFRVKRVFHSGVWGDACSAVASNGDGTGTITFGVATTDHQFQSYDLSLIAGPLGSTAAVPIADFSVMDHIGGVYHVSPDPVAVGLSTAGGYVFVMRTRPTAVTSTTIEDTNFANAYNSGGGLAASAEVGNRLRIIRGTGRGQQRSITANTSTKLTIDTPWDVTPDNTSRFIIEEQAWQPGSAAKLSSSALTASPAPAVATVSVENYRIQTILVQALILDSQGNASLDRFSPLRELYVWGGQGTRTIAASDTMLGTDSLVSADATGGAIVYTCLSFALVPNQTFTVTKIDSSAHSVTIQIDTGANPTDAFDDGTTSIVLAGQGDSSTFRVHG